MKNSVLWQEFASAAGRGAAAISLALAFVLASIVGAPSAQAQTYKERTLYTFTGAADGGAPYGGLTMDVKGDFYGVTGFGGASGVGVVYKVSGKGKETVLHSFSGGGDGEYPIGNLIMDANGTLYGVTSAGGTAGAGTVYKVSDKGKETVLYSFTGGADGASPSAGLTMDSKGNLYGTTSLGGAAGAGTLYKLSGKGKETVLYSFTGGVDGKHPYANLIRDAKGNLYGTTNKGGSSGAGVVYKVSGIGKETVLYSFTGGADGGNPYAGLIRDAKENLYGTANAGGSSGNGVVYKVSGIGKETVLYSFTGGADGGSPGSTGLVSDGRGNLYGTTVEGGASGTGTVFKVSGIGKETVLYSFTGGADGADPDAGVIRDAKGALYGTTSGGGADAWGTVFKLIP